MAVTLGHALIGQHEHGVAREHSQVGIPLLMYGGLPPAHIGIVHKVVVEECVIVVGLQGASTGENLFGVILKEVVGQKHQRGADAFAPHGEHILDGSIEGCRLAVVRQAVKIAVYQLQEFISCFHFEFFLRFDCYSNIKG